MKSSVSSKYVHRTEIETPRFPIPRLVTQDVRLPVRLVTQAAALAVRLVTREVPLPARRAVPELDAWLAFARSAAFQPRSSQWRRGAGTIFECPSSRGKQP